MADPPGLNPSEQQALADKLLARQREATLIVDAPVAVFTGGQPGAGKSAIRTQIVTRSATQGGVIEIDPD